MNYKTKSGPRVVFDASDNDEDLNSREESPYKSGTLGKIPKSNLRSGSKYINIQLLDNSPDTRKSKRMTPKKGKLSDQTCIGNTTWAKLKE